MAKTYEHMTADELEDVLRDLQDQQSEIRQKQLQITEIYDQKRTEELAQRQMDRMSESQRKALVKVAQEGIPSQGD